MTNTDYIYAGTRAKTLENRLLSENQMELLLSAKSVDEVYKVLQDTFLAPHLVLKEEDKKDKARRALEESIREAKGILSSIAPAPMLLSVLWLRYDYHNLKAIIKGKRVEEKNSDILQNCFNMGVFSPEDLVRAYE
jgi:V/A-type H+-transporting ATPase subunit C